MVWGDHVAHLRRTVVRRALGRDRSGSHRHRRGPHSHAPAAGQGPARATRQPRVLPCPAERRRRRRPRCATARTSAGSATSWCGSAWCASWPRTAPRSTRRRPRPTSTSSSSPRSEPRPRDPRHAGCRPGFRPDIQALRALAVSAVLLYHFWPGLVPGGYVGVDVFFVVSGFLITGLLVRELEETGRIDLLAFYAGRVRRLLPAALLVLGVTLAVLVLFMPPVVLAEQRRRDRRGARLRPQLGAGRAAGRLLRRLRRPRPGPALLVAEPRGAVLRRLAHPAVPRGRDRRAGPLRHVRRRALGAVTAIGLLSLVIVLVPALPDRRRRLLQHPGARLGVRPRRTGRAGAARRASASPSRVLGAAGVAAVVWSCLTMSAKHGVPGWLDAGAHGRRRAGHRRRRRRARWRRSDGLGAAAVGRRPLLLPVPVALAAARRAALGPARRARQRRPRRHPGRDRPPRLGDQGPGRGPGQDRMAATGPLAELGAGRRGGCASCWPARRPSTRRSAARAAGIRVRRRPCRQQQELLRRVRHRRRGLPPPFAAAGRRQGRLRVRDDDPALRGCQLGRRPPDRATVVQFGRPRERRGRPSPSSATPSPASSSRPCAAVDRRPTDPDPARGPHRLPGAHRAGRSRASRPTTRAPSGRGKVSVRLLAMDDLSRSCSAITPSAAVFLTGQTRPGPRALAQARGRRAPDVALTSSGRRSPRPS